MSKRFTKIICGAIAVISAAALAFAPGCSNNWPGADNNDKSTQAVEGTNGGFVVETEEYAYFINGKSNYKQNNDFGSVVKGSVQRIKKSDLAANNYTNTTTIVPSVIYSGSYDAGLYIYNGYLYYTTPSTEKNTSGTVLNSKLDFKRTKLNGKDTTDGYIWQCTDNAIDYRYVSVNGVVYILYARTESLYGSSKTNIHSVNCNTGKNTLLAYGVSGYSFDTEDPENPYVYYTMDVPVAMGSSLNFGYNQLYRVRADVTKSPRSYDYSEVKGYNASSNPVYVNKGEFVFDGISGANASQGLTQFNYGYKVSGVDQNPQLLNGDYTYDIQWYKNGVLYFTRKDTIGGTCLYKITDDEINADSNRNAITANNNLPVFIAKDYTTEYTFVTMDDVLYAVETGSSGIFKKTVTFNDSTNAYEFGENIRMSDDGSATPIFVKEQGEHTYLYYSMTGGNGYTVNRLAIDGSNDDYNKLPTDEQSEQAQADYNGVQVLDIDACSGWYMPEFVDNTLLFASEVEGMTDFNYIMACDLSGENGIMTNWEIEQLNKRYDAISEKINDYNAKTNSDGSKTYENLAGALRYEFYTGDGAYLNKLIQAFVDIEGKDRYYYYSEESVQIAKDFITCTGEWATYKVDGNEEAFLTKKVNGKDVYSNKRDYYYSLVGKMSESDATAYTNYFRNNTAYLKKCPVDNSTWWEKLTTGERVGIIIGIVAGGLIVIGGAVVLTIFLIRRRKKSGKASAKANRMFVDLSDDKDIDVYGEDKEE